MIPQGLLAKHFLIGWPVFFLKVLQGAGMWCFCQQRDMPQKQKKHQTVVNIGGLRPGGVELWKILSKG